MILKTVVTTLDALAIITFVSFGLSLLKNKDDSSKISFILALLTMVNAFMIWC